MAEACEVVPPVVDGDDTNSEFVMADDECGGNAAATATATAKPSAFVTVAVAEKRLPRPAECGFIVPTDADILRAICILMDQWSTTFRGFTLIQPLLVCPSGNLLNVLRGAVSPFGPQTQTPTEMRTVSYPTRVAKSRLNLFGYTSARMVGTLARVQTMRSVATVYPVSREGPIILPPSTERVLKVFEDANKEGEWAIFQTTGETTRVPMLRIVPNGAWCSQKYWSSSVYAYSANRAE
jgi:hypothetical protein